MIQITLVIEQTRELRGQYIESTQNCYYPRAFREAEQ